MTEPLSDEDLATFGDGADVTGWAPQWQVAKLVTEILRLRAEIRDFQPYIHKCRKCNCEILVEPYCEVCAGS